MKQQTYGKEFEERRQKVNSILASIKTTEDHNLVNAVKGVTNIEDVFGDEYKARLSNTPFSATSMKELLANFKQDKFNTMDKETMKMLFQEVYNREAKNYGMEPRYVTTFDGTTQDGYNGYMNPTTNTLAINGALVDRYKGMKDGFHKNSRNIGAHTLLTLVHETQHTCQTEGVMNFVLGREKSKKERARNAITLMKLALQEYAYEEHEEGFEPDDVMEVRELLQNSYWYDMMEHGANMAPVRYLNKAIKEGTIDEVFIEAGKARATKDIHISECVGNKEIENALNTRADKMEDIVVKSLRFFKSEIAKGVLKDQVVTVLDEYLKKDENGKSQFNKDVHEEFDMCLNFIRNAKIQNKTADSVEVLTK